MALLAIAIYDTIDNKRSGYTNITLQSLLKTVDFKKHRLFLFDNASCQETLDTLNSFEQQFNELFCKENLTIQHSETNIGTANAINECWKFKREGENCIKADNDIEIIQSGWVDLMEEAIQREPHIGIIGLKRKDCAENSLSTHEYYRSVIMELPHEAGQKWLYVETVAHVMGTCQMYSTKLLDKIGFLYQNSVYGFDDAMASLRSKIAGFYNCFLIGVEINHIDTGGTEYSKWKQDHAGEQMQAYGETARQYSSGEKDIYYNPFK